MEMLTYKCPVCGFVYQVPAYWSDFDAEATLTFEHMDFQNQKDCEETTLKLVKQAVMQFF